MANLKGCSTIEHFLDAPLDYHNDRGTIRLFAREVRAPGHSDTTPMLVFLQGGPGFPSPRPMAASGWLAQALRNYRVLLVDQRGTGRSSLIDRASLTAVGSPDQQAQYLSLFRADNIVRDCETWRSALLGTDTRWSVLGQSFGGFCTFTYLSFFPDSLSAAFVTGGIPAIHANPEEIYQHTYPRVEQANRRYFARYPEDQATLQEFAAQLLEQPATLPGGDQLSVERLQQLGLLLGASDGDDLIHYLLESLTDSTSFPPGYNFLHGLERLTDFNTNPIFTLLHEACYTQGVASNWAAQRVRAEYPQFNWQPDRPFLFTGEMLYPWMTGQYRELRPMAGAAQLLAEKSDWPALYDAEQLARNTIPIQAAVYFEDMYVDCELSLSTAAQTGNIQTWVTNEYAHNGLRADGERVFARLYAMLENG